MDLPGCTKPQHRNFHYMARPADVCAALLIVLLATACNGQRPVVTEVLNYAQCQQIDDGVNQLDFKQLAAVRGSRLLPSPASATQQQVQATPPGVVLVSVYAGQRPTAGYALRLLEAQQQADHVRLVYEWQKPAADAIVAQVLTQPCSVVQIDYSPDPQQQAQSPHGKVSAWLDDDMLGELIF